MSAKRISLGKSAYSILTRRISHGATATSLRRFENANAVVVLVYVVEFSSLTANEFILHFVGRIMIKPLFPHLTYDFYLTTRLAQTLVIKKMVGALNLPP